MHLRMQEDRLMRTDRTTNRTAPPGRLRPAFVRILGLLALLWAPVLAGGALPAAFAAAPVPAPPVSPADPEHPGIPTHEPPDIPEAPEPPEPPRKVVKSLTASPGGAYTLASDESHRGNLYLLGTKLLLAGDQ